MNVDAFPAETFTGKIKFLDAGSAPTRRNFLVRAEIPNPDKKLLPGMFANVVVRAGAPQQVVTVPRTAVTYSLYGDSVFVAEAGAAGGRRRAGGARAGRPALHDRSGAS